MGLQPTLPLRYVLTVSELTEQIKDLLEAKFSEIWIEGEISNFRTPPSGHLYFTLKDHTSQIRAVFFKNQARGLRFIPEDGLHVVCRGRVSLYEKRGEYQLVLDSMEPKGVGALQLAFLQLKERLEKEGLFDASHKRTIPPVPQRIGIVTSPTGAVIRDMVRIIHRRFENVSILLYPVRVQGEGAPSEIARGIAYFNDRKAVDVIIVGRGGGSLEDLWAFNEEEVARAIYGSRIPIISAVGHETDYTIADFVADLRAPTPSAAAELIIKDKGEIERTLLYLKNLLENRMIQILQDDRTTLLHFKKRMTSPRKRVETYYLRIDELLNRLSLLTSWFLKANRNKVISLQERVSLQSPRQKMTGFRSSIVQAEKRMEQIVRHMIEIRRKDLGAASGKLESLSPLAILQRGYSITQKTPTLEVIREASQVSRGDEVRVRLHRGTLLCEVKRADPGGRTS